MHNDPTRVLNSKLWFGAVVEEKSFASCTTGRWSLPVLPIWATKRPQYRDKGGRRRREGNIASPAVRREPSLLDLF